MGNLVNRSLVFVQGVNERPKKPVRVDERKRNSLAFYITRYLKFNGEDYNQLVQEIKQEKESQSPKKKSSVRDQKNSLIAETIALGSMQEVRFQVINNFRKINKNYKDPWCGNTLIHLMCQEGYLNMLQFIYDETKHSRFDHVEIDLTNENDRDRVPFFLCFTPPTSTTSAIQNGMERDGTPVLVKPESIEIITDWTLPGSEKKRQEIIAFLIQHGQDVNVVDFHNYNALHYAAMWGWCDTIKLLIKQGMDVNSATAQGQTALLFAVEFAHLEAVQIFLEHPDIQIDKANADGCTPLILAVEQGSAGSNMDIINALLEKGADTNVLTLKQKTALKLACGAQNVEIVNALFDHNVQRRPSALELLTGDALVAINHRIAVESAEAKRLAALAAAKDSEDMASVTAIPGYRQRSPWGAWVQYHDKKGRGVFYYNTVTRVSQWERPQDYIPNKDLGKIKGIKKVATFGMSFYH